MWARVFRARQPRALLIKLPTKPGRYVCSARGELVPETQELLEREATYTEDDNQFPETRFIFTGREWRAQDRTLSHGSAVGVPGVTLVFLETPDPPPSEFDAAIAAKPDDGALVTVWADWLLERGNKLGEYLASQQLWPGALEGLAPLLGMGELWIGVRNGLIKCAGLNLVTAPFPARLTSVPIARWMQELTFSGPDIDLDMIFAVLLNGPALPALNALSFGHTRPELLQTREMRFAYQALRKRSPNLRPEPVFYKPVTRAELQVFSVPEGISFKAPIANGGRIPLTRDVWLGSPRSRLVLAADAARRPPLATGHFVISLQSTAKDTSPFWRITSQTDGVSVNDQFGLLRGRILRDNDVIGDASGIRFIFHCE